MKNIDSDIDTAILENIDIDRGILQNINIDKISYRLEFGISNTPIPSGPLVVPSGPLLRALVVPSGP